MIGYNSMHDGNLTSVRPINGYLLVLLKLVLILKSGLNESGIESPVVNVLYENEV